MAKKRNRITKDMSKIISNSSPLIKKAHSSLNNDETTKEIELRLLEYNPYQPRINIDSKTLNELILSIEQNGLLQPITVTKKDDGKFIIVAGHRRYEAFKIMGKQKIPANILNNIKQKDLAVLSLTENIIRDNLHPIENAIAMKNILDNKIVESQNKLAHFLGISKGYVSKLLTILKLPQELITFIKQDNYTDVDILNLLNKLSNKEQILDTYNKIKKLNRKDAYQYIKNILNNTNDKKDRILINETKVKINLSIDKRKLSIKEIEELNKYIEKIKSLLN